jgi:hypothetical protein
VTESLPGQIYSNTKTPWREFSLNFDGIGNTEKSSYKTMIDAVGIHTAIFVQVSATVSTFTEYLNVFFTEVPEFDYVVTSEGDVIWKMGIKLREVK